MRALRGLDRNCRQTVRTVFGRWSRGRRRLLQSVDLLYEQEDYKGDDNKVKCGLEKDSVVDGRCSCCLGRGERGLWRSGQIDKQAGEIHLSHQQSKGRHQHVANERRDDLPEGSADNDTDCHVEHVALHGKFFKFFQHSYPSRGLSAERWFLSGLPFLGRVEVIPKGQEIQVVRIPGTLSRSAVISSRYLDAAHKAFE